MPGLSKVFSGLMRTPKHRKDWRSKMSGAFDERQIFWSLLVLAVFYIGYTSVNGFFDTSVKDEHLIAQSCSCKSSHREFYISWFALCQVLWLIVHTIFFYKLLVRHEKKHDKKQADNQDQKKHHTDPITIITVLKKCREVVWYQYYKLFVVGYPNVGENLNLAKIDRKLEIERKRAELREEENYDEEEPEDPIPLDLEDLKCASCSSCWNKLKANPSLLFSIFTKIFLTAAKYLAQLATVPLLTLQMFDSYALLCFAASDYCSSTSKYRFHVLQIIITFAFYCSLGLSFLTSAMLAYNPWPKPDKQEDTIATS